MDYITNIIYAQGSGKTNEDFYVVNDSHKIFGVLDGATSLDGVADGRLCSYTIGEFLSRNNHLETSLVDLVRTGNNLAKFEYCTRYNVEQKDYDSIPIHKLSSCGIAIAKVNEEEDIIEFVQSGDCMIVVKTIDNKTIVVGRDNLYEFDQKNLKLHLEKFDEYGGLYPINELRHIDEEVLNGLIQVRDSANNLGIFTYNILNGKPNSIDFLYTKTMKKSDVKEIVFLTDGLLVPTEMFDSGEDIEAMWKHTGKYAFEQGLYGIFDLIMILESDDVPCEKFKRFKIHDDKSAVHLKFIGKGDYYETN